jgi:hypothetical protein
MSWTLGMRGREGKRMRRTIVLAGMVLLLFSSLAACGRSDEQDPFIGTWNDASGHPDYWVISKTADAYSVTGFITTFPHAERHGDQLTFWTEPEATLGQKPRIKMTVTSTGPDELMLTDAYGPGVQIRLHKASDSTMTPSPFYGRESPSASP